MPDTMRTFSRDDRGREPVAGAAGSSDQTAQKTAVETSIAPAAPGRAPAGGEDEQEWHEDGDLDALGDDAQAWPADRDRKRLRPAPDQAQRRRDEHDARGRARRAGGTRARRRRPIKNGISHQSSGTQAAISRLVPTM